jgi:DNA-binding MarR family transcriptional regulator
MPEKFNSVVYQPTRLSILSALSVAKEINFTYLRDQLVLTDGNLSRHLQILENAGYIKISKTFKDKKPKTWIGITKSGRQALTDEIKRLETIIKQAKP